MTLHVLHLKGMPILEQLRLEEALLRTDQRNFFLINEGSSPAIVMGISGQVEELVDISHARDKTIPIIKRFSGGGTVVVDENTLFTSFIAQKNFLLPFACYPEPILRWSEDFYKIAFDIPHFALRENDFVLGSKKCGGNAQYIQKERWLLHTSFLWDYCPDKMQLLLHPKKTPQYRDGRPHTDFLTNMSTLFSEKGTLVSQLKNALFARFSCKEIALEEVTEALTRAHRQATVLV